MLDNNKIQYIGKIENSNNVVIINGNLTIDGQISKDLHLLPRNPTDRL